MYLPRQPLVNQKPWAIAGVLLAVVFLLFVALTYYKYSKG
jgi:amino acid transporter